MNKSFNTLKERIARVQHLNKAASVLKWDQEINMPLGGAEDRAAQMSTLRGIAHRMFTDNEVGALLGDLPDDAGDPDSNEGALLRYWRKHYEKATKIPAEWVEAHTKATSLAHHSWVEAREADAFGHFADDLRRIIELKRELAEFLAPYDDIYDPHLDTYQEGTTTTQIGTLFEALKPRLIELTGAVSAHGDAVDASLLSRSLAPQRQVAFGRVLAATLGYDFRRGRLDESSHPFTTRFGLGDVRITTRVIPGNFFYCFKSSIHEAGHAMHGQNLKPALAYTGLDNSGGTAIAESQSRFYENIIGRSRVFWRVMFPQLRAFFAPTFDDITAEGFYRAVNHVTPSLIRVRADEVTYGLHVILRFEIEHALINEELTVDELTDAWNDRMADYLGITPPTDTDGVLQDIHWSSGFFGYFPGYLLGSILSVQLWEAMQGEHPHIVEEFAAGNFSTALTWLSENVMQHGARYTLPELTERAIGGELDYKPFMDYLHTKFGELYGV